MFKVKRIKHQDNSRFSGKTKSKGFSLIELIVVIAILGILVLLASPKFMGYTKKATWAKHIANVKMLEDSMDRYKLDNNDKFPRLSDIAYTDEEVTAYAKKIFDITGEEVSLDPEGNYYDIDYIALRDYVKIPNNDDRPHYILQNPVGKVFLLDELTGEAEVRVDFTLSAVQIKQKIENEIIKDIQDLFNQIQFKMEGKDIKGTENLINQVKAKVTILSDSKPIWQEKLDNIEKEISDILDDMSPTTFAFNSYGGNHNEFIAPVSGQYELIVEGARGGEGGDVRDGSHVKSKGRPGIPGNKVSGMFNLEKGDVLYIYQGSMGNAGTNGHCITGSQYSGARGGGGGGGAASYISLDKAVTKETILIAAKGGNGGHGGSYSTAYGQNGTHGRGGSGGASGSWGGGNSGSGMTSGNGGGENLNLGTNKFSSTSSLSGNGKVTINRIRN